MTKRCADCGGPLPSPFNYCPVGDRGSACRAEGEPKRAIEVPVKREVEHWLLYTSDREHGGMKILGIFSSSEDAWNYYEKTYTDEDRYCHIGYVEQWQNEKQIEGDLT